MVKYDNILKAIEDYTIKCAVTLKGIKGALMPLMEGWTVESEYSDGSLEQFMDNIARFYRDNFNNKNPVDQTVSLPNGLSMRMVSVPDEASMPSHKEFKDTVKNSDDFLVKIDNKGLSITRNMGGAKSNTAEFNGPIHSQRDGIINTVWSRKDDNGAEKLWQNMKDGKISRKECNTGLRKIIENTQKDDMVGGTRFLTNQWGKNDVPLEIKYTSIEKSH